MTWLRYIFASDRGDNLPTVTAKISNHLESLGGNSSKIHPTSLVDFEPDAPGVWPVDATAGAVAVTLPDAAASAGWSLAFIKIDAGGNAVTVNRAGTDTLEGGTTGVALATQRARRRFLPIGIDWIFDI